MTSTNKKNKATMVDVLPNGRILKKEGDYALLETSADQATWFKLSPPPDNCETVVETLPKDSQILRIVGNMAQIADATWYKLVPPSIMAKTYFQVMKVKHVALITNPDAVLVQYARDKSMEWVKNIQVHQPKDRIARMKSPSWSEAARQLAAGREMANA